MEKKFFSDNVRYFIFTNSNCTGEDEEIGNGYIVPEAIFTCKTNNIRIANAADCKQKRQQTSVQHHQ
ncbi:Nuclear cap-binding protein subunit [Trichinella pseudospiralis]